MQNTAINQSCENVIDKLMCEKAVIKKEYRLITRSCDFRSMSKEDRQAAKQLLAAELMLAGIAEVISAYQGQVNA
jgi:hypothetical protein